MIFQTTGNTVEPTPEALMIPEFKAVWENDSSSHKLKARAAFAYIFHTTDPQSSYTNVLDRRAEVIADFLQGEEPSQEIEAAREKYAKLKITPEQRLLEASLHTANKLAEYFDSVDFTLTDELGKLVYSAKDVMGNLKIVGQVVKSLRQLREDMEKGIEEEEANRGGAKLNIFDDQE